MRALFLDFGNVFSTFTFRRFYVNLREGGHTSVSEESFDRIANEHYWPFDSGDISPDEYHRRMCAGAKMTVCRSEFDRCFTDIFDGHVDELDGLLTRVRGDVAIHLISNTNEVHYDRYIRHHPFLFKHIHPRRQILSFRSGASKPDPRIYREALAVAEVSPHEGLFVDDIEKNIAAWRDLGGHGIVWHGAEHDATALESAFRSYGILKD